MNAKYDALVARLDIVAQTSVKFYAICIRETLLKENTDMDLFQLEGYIKAFLFVSKCISNPADIAKKFNNFFITMHATLDLVDEKKITDISRCLSNKSSFGKDGISLKLLKYLLPA